MREEEEAGYPRGCYVYVELGQEGIFFNTHSSGSPQEHARQVCKEEVTGKLSIVLHECPVL